MYFKLLSLLIFKKQSRNYLGNHRILDSTKKKSLTKSFYLKVLLISKDGKNRRLEQIINFNLSKLIRK